MIFVTVGTHEQPFNRLVQYIDKWADIHDEEVIIQIGYSTYEPVNCRWQRIYTYFEMMKLVEDARIVICHGGPSSFMMPLQLNKTPIVVPRQLKFGEHVNDHQVKFCKEVEKKQGTIITVMDVDKIDKLIENFKNLDNNIQNNTAKFNELFEKIVNEILSQ